MNHKLSLLSYFFLLITANVYGTSNIQTTITFANMQNRAVQQTMEPKLDNFSAATSYDYYLFKQPSSTIAPQGSTQTTISYNWYYNWYGMTQFAYNYPGGSAEYGCFVTELRLSGKWYSYHIGISSYRPDPAFPNDYLVCHIEKITNDSFKVKLLSAQQEKNLPTNDIERVNIVDESNQLAETSYYSINLPIKLNPVLNLVPDNPKPQKVQDQPIIATSPKDANEIIVINHAGVPLTAGLQLLDKFSQLNDQYYIDQPKDIVAATSDSPQSVTIKVNRPDFGYFGFQRFNYHIKDQFDQSGCYIFKIRGKGGNALIASYLVNTQNNIEKPLYCVVTKQDTVEIYDDMNANKVFEMCKNQKICVSSYSNFKRKTLFYQDTDKVCSNDYQKIPLVPEYFLNAEDCVSGNEYWVL